MKLDKGQTRVCFKGHEMGYLQLETGDYVYLCDTCGRTEYRPLTYDERKEHRREVGRCSRL